MRVMSAGDGFKYLLKSVAAGDGDRDLSTPLTRYYTEAGCPPGFWLGSGLGGLGGGQLRPGNTVTEEQLELLLGMGRDPISGDVLGEPYRHFAGVAERIQARIDRLDRGLTGDERAVAVTDIEAEERARPTRRAVAGYDYTFSVPKSVSALWAVADGGTQSLIVAAHHAAVAEVVALLERDVATTRIGARGPDGAVAQVEVAGVIATAYDHYDSRAGDPQLHTHVVISNKVQGVHDGKWRTLDGRPMHAAVVALSEHYNGVLADRLTRSLGVGWDQRDRGRDRNPAWEITGVPDLLVEAFSSRSRAIEVEKDRLIAAYVAKHGRGPSAITAIKLRAQATLATRPDKTIRSLADLTADWRARAGVVLGQDAPTWATHLLTNVERPPVLRADDLPLDTLAEIGRTVVQMVGEKRTTWRRWNLHAEASRQIMGLRFASTIDREAVLGLIVDAAEGASLRLTPPELAASPVVFQRPDGSSVFRPKHSTVFSSTDLLAAEDRLLDLSRTINGPAVALRVIERVARRPDDDGRVLADDQVAALTAVAVSGRTVDVLVGPAGTGKTTAMNALRRAWEVEHSAGSVVGLAPSAAAAQVLADDLGIGTENTAKWLHDHTAHGLAFRAAQLVIVDEASLAGTLTLDRITSHANQVGAKVLLVGDWAQLTAVDAGGAFGLLVRDRTDTPELVDVRRFHHQWERHASLGLRIGNTSVIDTYQAHGRIHDGDTDTMLDTAYTAWLEDLAAGRSSVMIAETTETVTALNTRARLDRIIAGHVAPNDRVRLHDGTNASTGDLVITRRNDRRLLAGRGWVKNGDRWHVTTTHDDGSVTVRRAGQRGRASVRLPASYVAEHVELAYAVTAHRAQGSTVDTAHAIVAPSMTRETFYVAMTRGQHANTAYVTLDQPDSEDHHQPPGEEEATGRSVLYGVLHHVGTELSAHETIEVEHDRWAGIAQLAAEYETIAAVAQHDRWVALLERSGLTAEQVDMAFASEAFGPLAAELRRAEANGHVPDALVPRLVAARGFADVDDIAAVLHHRVTNASGQRRTGSARRRQAPRLIAGLIPHAAGPMSDDMRRALDERRHLIEQRARALAESALADDEPWTRYLGEPPRNARQRTVWMRYVETVAAYRDRYHIVADTPLGPTPEGTARRVDAARAGVAMRSARHLAEGSETRPTAGREAARQTGPTL